MTLISLLPHKKITHKKKISVREVHYFTDNVIVTNKQCLDHNVEYKYVTTGY